MEPGAIDTGMEGAGLREGPEREDSGVCQRTGRAVRNENTFPKLSPYILIRFIGNLTQVGNCLPPTATDRQTGRRKGGKEERRKGRKVRRKQKERKIKDGMKNEGRMGRYNCSFGVKKKRKKKVKNVIKNIY